MEDISYPLGKYHGADRLFTIPTKVRRQHIYLIGKTGTGKSTMMESMMLADIRAGRGFCLVDPHNTMAYRIADAVGNRVQDTVLLDPMSPMAPTFNIFSEKTHDPDELADHATEAFRHVHVDFWGPRLEDTMRQAFLLLIVNRLSLSDVPRLLTDQAWRHGLQGADRQFWQAQALRWSPAKG